MTKIEMELKKVDRIEKETALFCLDDCISTLAGYYQCDYEMMYAGGYKIREQMGIQGVASRYHVSLQNRFDNLCRYHGLYIYKCDCFWKQSLVKRMKKELEQKRPVLLLLNPYWCPWDDGFQRYDAVPGHCFLVQGEYSGGFLCADPYFDKDQLELPYTLFRKGIQEVYLTEPADRAECSGASGKGIHREALGNMFRRMSEEGYFDTLHRFAEDMSQSEDIFEEVRSDADFWISPLAVLLLQLNQSIQNIAVLIKYVGVRCGSPFLEEQGVQFWNLAVKWKQVRKLVIKLYFMKREDESLRTKAMERMYSIIDDMEKTAERIVEEEEQELSDGFIKSVDTIDRSSTDSGYYMVDLDRFMNNKAFLRKSGLQEGKLDADFSSIGNCYVLDDTKEVEPIRISGTAAAMTSICGSGNDNIACDGQLISIPEDRYSYLCLIGAAEFGNSTDVLTILTESGRVYEVEFQLTDYVYEPCFGESVVWKGSGIHKLERGYEWMEEDLYLYGQMLEMPDDTAARIILPVNPSIHIFAMLLHKRT